MIEGDILDAQAINYAVAQNDEVVHLAAQTGVPGSLDDPYHDCQLNVVGTLNVLEACRHARRRPGPGIVFASSNAPLGRQQPPATEDKAPLPISPYGASKLAAEGYCLAYHGSWGVKTTVLRFANVYGPYSSHKGSVIAKFVKDLREQGTLTIDGDGQQTRDFIYVGDLCQALLRACESSVSGEVFQIATGVETTISELATMVATACGRALTAKYGPRRGADIQRNYSLIAKARELLDWEPQVGLVEGLQKTFQWFETTRVDLARGS
jgi:UDP-glucose 4-epimerase